MPQIQAKPIRRRCANLEMIYTDGKGFQFPAERVKALRRADADGV
jgi:hypothetical protein